MSGPNYFEIEADDIIRAKNFYQSVFGWKFTLDKTLPIEYWRIDTGGQRGGLFQRTDALPQGTTGTNASTSSMETDDFDALSEKILSFGGKVTLPKFAAPGLCWQGYFQDPEGNMFGVYQPDAEAK